MPDRLPRELRVLYELARVVAAGPYSLGDVLGRIGAEMEREFGLTDVRLVRNGDDLLLDSALAQRWAVAEEGRVAIPLLIEGRCLGYLVADGADEGVVRAEVVCDASRAEPGGDGAASAGEEDAQQEYGKASGAAAVQPVGQVAKGPGHQVGKSRQ